MKCKQKLLLCVAPKPFSKLSIQLSVELFSFSHRIAMEVDYENRIKKFDFKGASARIFVASSASTQNECFSSLHEISLRHSRTHTPKVEGDS
jgi:hypothetical protein